MAIFQHLKGSQINVLLMSRYIYTRAVLNIHIQLVSNRIVLQIVHSYLDEAFKPNMNRKSNTQILVNIL